MITIRQQGWITRWDKSRLQSGVNVNYIFRVLKSTAPYFAVVSILILLSFGVVKYKDVTAISNSNIKFSDVESIIASGTKSTTADDCPQAVLNNLENQQFGYYAVEQGDTLLMIAQKYNADISAIIEANIDIIPNPDYIEIGQRLKIPARELGNIFNKEGLISFTEPKITFDESNTTVFIEGRGSVVTPSKIYNVLDNKSILERLSDKEWLLKANLFVEKGVTLVIDDSDVSWLKFKSGKDGFIWLQSNSGNILIKNTKITSWDEDNQAPDTNYEDGRSFILVEQNGRMDIMNSELSFLGYNDDLKQGVAWHGTGDSPGNYLITGQVLDSEFYDNYSGIYLSGTIEIMIANNEIAYNTRYGIDIRNGANNLLIENNWLHDNGNGNCTQELF